MSDVTPRAAILREAERLITGDRNKTYGSPTQNFQDTADVWSVLFHHKMLPGARFLPQDVAAFMVALKLVRRIASDKADNWTDMAGYTGCGYEAAVETGAFDAIDARPADDEVEYRVYASDTNAEVYDAYEAATGKPHPFKPAESDRLGF